MLGVPEQSRYEFDGAPIAYTAADIGSSTKTEQVTVEFWNSNQHPQGMEEGLYFNNTYKALRLISDDNSLYYSVWCTGEHEFYDMNNDPGQMSNRLGSPPKGSSSQYYRRPESQLISRLDALLMVTKSCAGDSCRKPWASMFADGHVTDLSDAMAADYDSFFANQPQVSFASCKNH